MKNPGLRLFAAPCSNLFGAGQFLSQLMQSFAFTWTCRLTPGFSHAEDRAGIGMMGHRYAYLAADSTGVSLYQGTVTAGTRFQPAGVAETRVENLSIRGYSVWLQMRVKDGQATFWAGADGQRYTALGGAFPMEKGGWTGARPGIFCGNFGGVQGGHADFAFVEVKDSG
jgi:beta-xylosidase